LIEEHEQLGIRSLPGCFTEVRSPLVLIEKLLELGEWFEPRAGLGCFELNSAVLLPLSVNFKEGRYLRKYLGYSVFNSGWVFLDEDDDDGFGGCIRLFPKCSNNGYRSKCSFWKDEEGKIQIGNA